MKKVLLCLTAAGLFAFTSCSEDSVTETTSVTSSVLIANEGAFVGGTGTITAYNTGAKTTEKNMFQKANFITVGNILNEIYIDNERMFLSVNVSGNVIMCNTNTLMVEARFENLGFPRKMMHVSGDKYYSTDWASNVIHVLDAATQEEVKDIPTGKGPESMVVVEGMVYVTNSGGTETDNSVYVIDGATDVVVDTIFTAENPAGIVHDKYNKLWILCSGTSNYTTPALSTAGTLISYSLDSARIEDSLTFDIVTKKPTRLAIDGTGENIYFVDDQYGGDLYKMSTQDSILPILPLQSGNFYGLGFDAVNDEVYVSDALDYNSNGDVYRFSSDGTAIDQVKAGLVPTSFGFR